MHTVCLSAYKIRSTPYNFLIKNKTSWHTVDMVEILVTHYEIRKSKKEPIKINMELMRLDQEEKS